VRHCGAAIAMDEDPHEVLRARRDTSISAAAKLVATGDADALVSAGNTGAIVLTAARQFELVSGVKKAALASVFPRQTEYPGQDVFGLLLDVGATVHCDAEELVRFAVMGSASARRISKVSAPRVGLLNMGVEEGKGGPVLVEAYRLLRALPTINFIGNVEGHDVATGRADVIVTEGLLGNVVLKLLEGIGDVAAKLASRAAEERWRWRVGMAMLSTGITRMRDLTDYRSYGGAPVLGFHNICIKAHGRSTGPAISNAVKLAAKAARASVAGEIAEAVAQIR
jgi:glycerol-3-phosphate acyltransferase PlsX